MRKLARIVFVVLIISAILVKVLVYYDPETDCMLKVIPSYQPSNWKMKEVAALLKVTAPEEYTYMCANVTNVNKNLGCGGFDGGCFYTDQSKTIYIGNDQDNIALTAAVFVHELCHARQYNEGRVLQEQECYEKGALYLENLYLY